MSFLQDVKDGISRIVEKKYGNNLSAFSSSIKFTHAKLWKFLDGMHGMNSIALGELLDHVGARVVFPDERKDRTKNCVFVSVSKTNGTSEPPVASQENYKAIPLVDVTVATNHGVVEEKNTRSWVLVHALHSSVHMKTNIIAVEIGRGQRSMMPTLHPLDIVLVDLDDKMPSVSRNMYLVKESDGSVLVRRVSTDIRNGKTHLIFYSDNAQEYPPSMYVLEDDYHGDIGNAIIGKILWSFSDMSQK